MIKAQIQLAGIGEKTQYLVHEYNDNMVRFMLHYPGIVDAGILRNAMKVVIERVDILHASFFTDKIKAYWQINKEYEETCFFEHMMVDSDVNKVAEPYFLLNIEPQSKTQIKCYLVQNDYESEIVLLISHLCMDGGDGKYLLGKITEAYNMLLVDGLVNDLKIKNGSRAPQQAYDHLSKKEYLSLLRNPISKMKSAFPYPSEIAGENQICKAEVSVDVMKNAREQAKGMGATANDILLTAYYHAYASLPEIEEFVPMSIMSMFDLRRHCKSGDSAGLCNMSGSLPTMLEKGIGGTFEGTLEEVVKQTTAIKENPLAGLEGVPLLYGISRSLPMGILLQIAGKVYGSFSIGLTNLGNLSGATLKLGSITPDKAQFAGPLKKKPAMQVSVISLDGTCELCAIGDFTEEDAKLVQRMLNRMVEEIEGYAQYRINGE